MPLVPVKKKETNDLIILQNFINCPIFKDIRQTLHYKVAIE